MENIYSTYILRNIFQYIKSLKNIDSWVIIFSKTTDESESFSYFLTLSWLQEIDKNFRTVADYECRYPPPSSLTDGTTTAWNLLHGAIREVRTKGLVKTSSSLRDYLELTFGILSIKLFASESLRAIRKR